MISIILPVYNVAPYLSRCLHSIEFRISAGDQIIIVNDGSTDNSQEIIDSFTSIFPSVISVKQANKGLSAARNTGLKYATGEYIWFIDSDDYIDKDEFEPIADMLCRRDYAPDIICFGRTEVYSPKHTFKMPIHLETGYYNSGAQYYSKSMNDGSYRTNVWDKILKRELIHNHNLKFEEGLLYEDMLFCLQAFMYAGNIAVCHCYPYCYIHYNSNSITKKVSKKHLDVLTFIEKATYFIKKGDFQIHENSKEFQLLIFNWVSSCLMNKYAYMSLFNDDAKYIYEKIMDNRIFINSAKYCSRAEISFRYKLFAKLLLLSPTIYKITLHMALKVQNIRLKYI